MSEGGGGGGHRVNKSCKLNFLFLASSFLLNIPEHPFRYNDCGGSGSSGGGGGSGSAMVHMGGVRVGGLTE